MGAGRGKSRRAQVAVTARTQDPAQTEGPAQGQAKAPAVHFLSPRFVKYLGQLENLRLGLGGLPSTDGKDVFIGAVAKMEGMIKKSVLPQEEGAAKSTVDWASKLFVKHALSKHALRDYERAAEAMSEYGEKVTANVFGRDAVEAVKAHGSSAVPEGDVIKDRLEMPVLLLRGEGEFDAAYFPTDHCVYAADVIVDEKFAHPLVHELYHANDKHGAELTADPSVMLTEQTMFLEEAITEYLARWTLSPRDQRTGTRAVYNEEVTELGRIMDNLGVADPDRLRFVKKLKDVPHQHRLNYLETHPKWGRAETEALSAACRDPKKNFKSCEWARFMSAKKDFTARAEAGAAQPRNRRGS